MRPSTIGWSAALGRVQAACFGQPPRQTLPLRLRRRGSRACPARHGARPAPRLAGPSRSTLGPSALAGRRLAGATAGLRKASELFRHIRHVSPISDILMQRAIHVLHTLGERNSRTTSNYADQRQIGCFSDTRKSIDNTRDQRAGRNQSRTTCRERERARLSLTGRAHHRLEPGDARLRVGYLTGCPLPQAGPMRGWPCMRVG